MTSLINYFAQTDFRGKKTTFGIKAEDRSKHVYIIGKTGMGKSTLLENLAIQDIKNGEGMAFIDPHGKTADLLLDYVPQERIKDVVYFAPFDLDYPIAFNVMEDVGKDQRHLVLSGLMSAFKKLFGEESFSDRMQYILQNTILALLEYPGSTMLGINKMLAEKDYRNKVIANITDPSVKSYWVKEYAGYTERFAAEAVPAIQNKIGQFTSNPLVRNIIGQPKSNFDIRQLMDQKKILIINLSKGLIGEQNASLLGSLLITKLYLGAMSRANVSDNEIRRLPPFYLYVDEFQSFVNDTFADILSEARKYKLSLTIAHQYVEQMPETVRSAVFGNVGTTIAFRVGPLDAELLEKIFAPVFTAEDLVNLGFAQIYLTLMIDGVGSRPFSAVTLPPIVPAENNFKAEIVEWSRQTYSQPRIKVEEVIGQFHDEKGNSEPKLEPVPKPRATSIPKPKPPTPPPAPVVQVATPAPAPITPKPQLERAVPEAKVSLNTLVAVAPKSKDTGKHKDALRAALNDVLTETKPAPTSAPTSSQPMTQTTKEIPEDQLRSMLKVDGK
ncbi:MAG: type IV secretion system DNA-binding domain-containing protein [Candidatus Vogelbacteria bacterium]|nr:type IV secretion system DNA-binding domain-containing protein [Candidatus Vogelbacteria bacterium]